MKRFRRPGRARSIGQMIVMAASVGLAACVPPVVAQRAEGRLDRSLLRNVPLREAPSGHGMGLIPSTEADLARYSRFRITPVPRGLRPASVQLTEFLPPVQSQGKQNSCVAWATAYYTYSYSVADQRKFGAEQLRQAKFQFSPAFIYNQINNGKDQGSHLYQAFELLRKQGCASLAEMPYNQQDYTTQPADAARQRSERYRAREVGSLVPAEPGKFDPEPVKTYLAEVRHPVALAIPIFKDFPNGRVDADFVYHLTVPINKDTLQGFHAVTITGYDEAKQAFRLCNSWGPEWGDHGFIWIGEDFMKLGAMDGWGMVVAGGPLARDPRANMLRVTPHVTLEPPPTPNSADPGAVSLFQLGR
jgi:Papain family cysteine protease